MTPTWTFPCNDDKSPISQHGFKDAFQGMEWRNAPLVGAPTGARNGFDVLDVDPDGMGWYATKFAALPATRRHETPRGVHLLFRSAPGLRCSTSRIVPGVHIRAEGGYVVWWPREGYAVDDVEVAEWPEWLLEAGKGKPRSHVSPSTSLSPLRPIHGDVASLLDGLRRLDPVEWRGERFGGREESYDQWLELMMASKAGGISKEDWIAWCVGDECYRGDAEVIGYKWDSVPARHSGALFKALSQRGIKYRAGGNVESAGAHMSATAAVSAETPSRAASRAAPPRNLQSRSRGLISWLARNATGDGLFSAACLFAELGVTQEATTKLVKNNLPSLRRALGDAEFTRQIARAYARIEGKQNAGENQNDPT